MTNEPGLMPPFYRRSITAARLAEILKQLPEDATVEVNQIGFLTVFDRGDRSRMLGYIDIALERYET